MRRLASKTGTDKRDYSSSRVPETIVPEAIYIIVIFGHYFHVIGVICII